MQLSFMIVLLQKARGWIFLDGILSLLWLEIIGKLTLMNFFNVLIKMLFNWFPCVFCLLFLMIIVYVKLQIGFSINSMMSYMANFP